MFRHICIDRFSPYHERPEAFGITNIRPWAVYATPYPDTADVDNLAYRFIGDYPCEARGNIHLIKAIADELSTWKDGWQKIRLVLAPLGGDLMMIYDNRPFHGKTVTHTIPHDRVREIMVCGPYTGPAHQEWALARHLGVVSADWYTPLVTASPDLLQALENREELPCPETC